ncbi:hypothetical protein YC2023_088876 [Brassica napus]
MLTVQEYQRSYSVLSLLLRLYVSGSAIPLKWQLLAVSSTTSVALSNPLANFGTGETCEEIMPWEYINLNNLEHACSCGMNEMLMHYSGQVISNDFKVLYPTLSDYDVRYYCLSTSKDDGHLSGSTREIDDTSVIVIIITATSVTGVVNTVVGGG